MPLYRKLYLNLRIIKTCKKTFVRLLLVNKESYERMTHLFTSVIIPICRQKCIGNPKKEEINPSMDINVKCKVAFSCFRQADNV